MPGGRPPKKLVNARLHPQQYTEQVRWKIIAALAELDLERFEPLLQAARFMDEGSRRSELMPISGRLVKADFSEPEWAGHIFSLIREWSLAVGLVRADCDFNPGEGRLHNLGWTEDYGLTIVRSGLKNLEDIHRVCRRRIHKFALQIPAGMNFLDLPRRITIIGVPQESDAEFESRITKQLREFRQAIRDWEEKNGYKPIAEKMFEDKHFRWVALRLLPEAGTGRGKMGASIHKNEGNDPDTINLRVREILKAADIKY